MEGVNLQFKEFGPIEMADMQAQLYNKINIPKIPERKIYRVAPASSTRISLSAATSSAFKPASSSISKPINYTPILIGALGLTIVLIVAYTYHENQKKKAAQN